MNETVSIQDFKALEVYLRLLKRPTSYCVGNDLFYLKHWLDLTSENFASRLKKEYPRLTNKEMNLCCFQRMGYSIEEMSRMLQVKEDTIKRNMYRACTHLNISNNREVFKAFVAAF